MNRRPKAAQFITHSWKSRSTLNMLGAGESWLNSEKCWGELWWPWNLSSQIDKLSYNIWPQSTVPSTLLKPNCHPVYDIMFSLLCLFVLTHFKNIVCKTRCCLPGSMFWNYLLFASISLIPYFLSNIPTDQQPLQRFIGFPGSHGRFHMATSCGSHGAFRYITCPSNAAW